MKIITEGLKGPIKNHSNRVAQKRKLWLEQMDGTVIMDSDIMYSDIW